jgi:4-hydroxy-tetrahydrodipicolinate synthase
LALVTPDEFAARLRHTVIPAVPVPFAADRMVDGTAMQMYARWLARQGVGAVAVWAHTGRGLQLSAPERAHVLDVWRGALGDIPIVCGVGVPVDVELPTDPVARTARSAAETASMAESAREGGAGAVLVYPPTSLRGMSNIDARVLEVHQAVSDVGLPVITFYLYEAAGGIPYSSEALHAILALPNVIGIKVATLDSVMTFQDIALAVRGGAGGSLLITGEDRFLGYSLMAGADAALIGLASACTDCSVDLLNAWFARDHETFHGLSDWLDRFAQATFTHPMEGYVQRLLWALQADDVIAVGALDPYGPSLPLSERDAVLRAVGDLRSR